MLPKPGWLKPEKPVSRGGAEIAEKKGRGGEEMPLRAMLAAVGKHA